MSITDKKAVELTQEGFEILCLWARNIAMLPLNEWLEALDHAETVGPFLDPTLYRDYIYSEKPKVIRELIEAGITLKAAVLKAQPLALKEIERESRERADSRGARDA